MVSSITYESLTGKLLVAAPHTDPDSYFARTVIYLAKYHHDEGAVGIVVNHPFPSSSSDLIKDYFKKDEVFSLDHEEAYIGGPIESDRGFILHSNQTCSYYPSSIYLSSNVGLLKNISNENSHPHKMFVFGYCGWRKEQLEAEIKRGCWFVLPLDNKIIFETTNAEKWDRALECLNISPIKYSNRSGNC